MKSFFLTKDNLPRLCLMAVTAALITVTGILISVLTMFAFVEYTWLMLPSGMLNIVLNFATMQTNPEQITYVIFSFYSIICVTIQFFRVRKLYAEQSRNV